MKRALIDWFPKNASCVVTVFMLKSKLISWAAYLVARTFRRGRLGAVFIPIAINHYYYILPEMPENIINILLKNLPVSCTFRPNKFMHEVATIRHIQEYHLFDSSTSHYSLTQWLASIYYQLVTFAPSWNVPTVQLIKYSISSLLLSTHVILLKNVWGLIPTISPLTFLLLLIVTTFEFHGISVCYLCSSFLYFFDIRQNNTCNIKLANLVKIAESYSSSKCQHKVNK